MIFIDHFNGFRWAFGIWAFKKRCTLMVCNVPLLRSSPSLGEVLHEKQSNLYFHPKLLCSWVVMNIITGIAMAEGLSMCTCPTKSGPRGVNAVGEEHVRMWHVLNVHKCVL